MITLQEWAAYIGVSKNTVIAWMKKYDKEKFEYDPRNIYSVFNPTTSL
jgi:transposase